MRAPHFCTSHSDWLLTSHSTVMIKMMQRVNKGSRKMYDRMRTAENCGRPGAIVW
jgi:hypothetical protein